jgi:hypothetical protein
LFAKKGVHNLCHQMGCVAVGEFGKGEKVDPVVLLVFDVHLEILFEDLCKGNLGRRSTLKQRTGEGGSKVNIEN